MKTVAVTAEFNPFHNGHAFLAERIRERYGRDAAIVAIMSGCFVQRGDVAVADPYFRAKTALLSGYDLILELPFPFSASGAETFTRAAVSLADALGCVDSVAFGSECGDLDALIRASDVLANENTRERLAALRETEEGKRSGTPNLIRRIVSDADPAVFGNGVGPNDLLAIGYIKALHALRSKIEPFAVKRVGGRYESGVPDDPETVGATALRTLLFDRKYEIFNSYIPAETVLIWKQAINDKTVPASLSYRLSGAVLASLIAADPLGIAERTGLDGGLIARLTDAARDAVSLDDLIARTTCRSCSSSEIRRMILAAWLGFTSPGPDERPLYTRVFGLNERGRELLRTIKQRSPLPILTKTADRTALPGKAREQAEFSLSADRLFGLALPEPRPASDAYRGAPCHITGKAR